MLDERRRDKGELRTAVRALGKLARELLADNPNRDDRELWETFASNSADALLAEIERLDSESSAASSVEVLGGH